MALVTRCSNPACLTLFRVTPAQLQAFGGQVRCGSCSTVFDAFPSLTTVADSALTPTAPPAPPAVADTPGTGVPGAAAYAETMESPSIGDAERSDTARDDEDHREADGSDRPDPGGRQSANPEASDPAAIQTFGAGEKVSEWTTAAVAPGIDAGSPPQPMVVEHVPDLPPEGSLDFVHAPSGSDAGDTDERATALSDDAWQAGAAVAAEVAVPADAAEGTGAAQVEGAAQGADAAAAAEGAKSPVDEDAPDLASVRNTESDGTVAPGAPHDPNDPNALHPLNDPEAASAPRPVEEATLVQPVREGAAATSAVVSQAALQADPVPQIAPELTDYSVTAGPPLRAASTQRRTSLVPALGGLLLVAAVAILVAGSDRLPAPLSHWLAPATLAALLREQALPVTMALVALLCFILRRHRTTWIVVAIVLALLLGGQALFAYRTQIASLYPASRPLLEDLCRLASCEVGLPKAADQLVIESSDLQAVDAARPNLIQLAATVRNRASIDVAFPAIEVTLTDAQDRPLARRVLLPDQYLAGRQPVRAGLRAGEDFSIRLTLDTTELRPVGYRLYLFYP